MKPLSDGLRQFKMNPAILKTLPSDDSACGACGGLGEIDVKVGVYEIPEFTRDEDGNRIVTTRLLDKVERCACPECGVCEVCAGRGYVRPALHSSHPEFGRLFPCPAHCEAARQAESDGLQRLIGRSRLPVEYRYLTFETFDELPESQRLGKVTARAAAASFVNNADGGYYVDRRELGESLGQAAELDLRNWLVFHGQHGRGKTGLAAAILNYLLSTGRFALYTRLQDLIKAIQARYGDAPQGGYRDEFGDVTADQIIDTVKRAPVLLLDEFDLPDAQRSDKQSIVENIIRFRHGEILPTVITTNLDADGVELRWGTTTMSVMRQRAHWIPVTGENLRPDVKRFDWG